MEEEKEAPSKPLALRFHFIEICGGAGKIFKFFSEMGWQVGLVIDLDNLRQFDLIYWILYLLEEGLLDSFLV